MVQFWDKHTFNASHLQSSDINKGENSSKLHTCTAVVQQPPVFTPPKYDNRLEKTPWMETRVLVRDVLKVQNQSASAEAKRNQKREEDLLSASIGCQATGILRGRHVAAPDGAGSRD